MTIPSDKSPDRITPGKPLETAGQSLTPGGAPAGFESYMQGSPQKTPSNVPNTPQGPTPMDVAKGPQISTAGVSYNTLLAQATTAKDSLGTVEKQLNDKNLQLKRSQSHLVRQKLGDANTHIQAAGSKLGLPDPGEPNLAGLTGVSRFIAMVNHGQDQLADVQQQLKDLSAKGADQSNPGEMMSIQIKMGQAQQEIEYTSTLLGKVIQSFTQILNTQL